MELLHYYIKKTIDKKHLKITWDKKSNGRPAWIMIKGFSGTVNFIMIHLGKKGIKGRKIQFYKTYLPTGLFLPIDYTQKEMQEFYKKFSEIYDREIINTNKNIIKSRFICKILKRYLDTNDAILDLGAGTGLITEIFVNEGYKKVTLLDYSREMLDRAKRRRKLNDCNFILCDIKNLDLKCKYDVVISNFSLGNPSYFSEYELKKTLKLVKKHLKFGGIIAITGYFNSILFENEFKKLESGIFTLNKEKKYYVDYFIGRKI